MTKISMIGAAPIAGVMRYPSEGAIAVSADEASVAVGAGVAIIDDLDELHRDELAAVARNERVDIGPAAIRRDLIRAIRARRTLRA